MDADFDAARQVQADFMNNERSLFADFWVLAKRNQWYEQQLRDIFKKCDEYAVSYPKLRKCYAFLEKLSLDQFPDAAACEELSGMLAEVIELQTLVQAGSTFQCEQLLQAHILALANMWKEAVEAATPIPLGHEGMAGIVCQAARAWKDNADLEKFAAWANAKTNEAQTLEKVATLMASLGQAAKNRGSDEFYDAVKAGHDAAMLCPREALVPHKSAICETMAELQAEFANQYPTCVDQLYLLMRMCEHFDMQELGPVSSSLEALIRASRVRSSKTAYNSLGEDVDVRLEADADLCGIDDLVRGVQAFKDSGVQSSALGEAVHQEIFQAEKDIQEVDNLLAGAKKS